MSIKLGEDHSADQIVEAHKCVNIDFWAKWQSSGYDLDDALDFSVQSNNSEVGKFTIYVTSYLDGMNFSIKNNSGFIKQKSAASNKNNGLIHFE